MLAYYGSHILHTAIAYFDVVLVEKGVSDTCVVEGSV